MHRPLALWWRAREPDSRKQRPQSGHANGRSPTVSGLELHNLNGETHTQKHYQIKSRVVLTILTTKGILQTVQNLHLLNLQSTISWTQEHSKWWYRPVCRRWCLFRDPLVLKAWGHPSYRQGKGRPLLCTVASWARKILFWGSNKTHELQTHQE